MAWSGGLAEWIMGDTAFLSVAFSWCAKRMPDYKTIRERNSWRTDWGSLGNRKIRETHCFIKINGWIVNI